MVPFLVATRTEHSVCLWHSIVTDLSGTNTIGELLEPVKVSTPNTTKKIHPFTATDCYGFPTLSKRFFAVCAGNMHIAYTPSFVWIEPSESNSLNQAARDLALSISVARSSRVCNNSGATSFDSR